MYNHMYCNTCSSKCLHRLSEGQRDVMKKMGYSYKKLAKTRLFVVVLAVFVFGIVLVLVNIYQLRLLKSDHDLYHGAAVEGMTGVPETDRRPVVWVVANRVSYCM